ncbi:MAG: hypothetical protein MJZ23_05280 [Paludibacteraceae bacterium]|nr:hypothetical protein [Paludibacteraceae bacterium]
MDINNYIFEDSLTYRFLYDKKNSILEISINGYFDKVNNKYVESDCTLVIKNWTIAKGCKSEDKHLDDIRYYFGLANIITWISSSKQDNLNILEMELDTFDGRLVYWYFENPTVELIMTRPIKINGVSNKYVANYEFKDHRCTRFFYDQDDLQLEITLDGYYDKELYKEVNKVCTIVIKSWSKAKGKLLEDSRYDDIDYHLGFVETITDFKFDEEESLLTMIVNTSDKRSVLWRFEDPSIDFIMDKR